jgi:hypothetical protein
MTHRTHCMETYDTYCLVPESADLAEPLDRLFRFDGVVYHDGAVDHPIHSGSAAATAFALLMRVGDSIRFRQSAIDHTEGGWLYRLEDGSPVIGLSGAADIPEATFQRALEAVIPECPCLTVGDQPPPMTRSQFMRRVERKP